MREGFKSPTLQLGPVYANPDSLPSKFPDEPATQWYYSNWNDMEGDIFKRPKFFTWIYPTLIPRTMPLSMFFHSGFNNFLVGNRFGFLKLGLWWKD